MKNVLNIIGLLIKAVDFGLLFPVPRFFPTATFIIINVVTYLL